MTLQTFIIEWETESLATLVVAEQSLRSKASELHNLTVRLALKEVNIEPMEGEL